MITEEKVSALNYFQNNMTGHPYTCCGSDGEGNNCDRSKHDDGILIATIEGWICPCGKYKQAYRGETEKL